MSYGITAHSAEDESITMASEAPLMLFKGKHTSSSFFTELGLYKGGLWCTTIDADHVPVVFLHVPFGEACFIGSMKYSDPVYGWGIGLQATCPASEIESYWFQSTLGLPPSGDTTGLRIYNANGTLIVDAGWGKFGSAEQVLMVPNTAGATVATKALSKPAFTCVNMYKRVLMGGGLETAYYRRFFRFVDSTTIRVDEIRTEGYGTPSGYATVTGNLGIVPIISIDATLYD